ncbi:hypothetical protein ABTJ80_19740, partial [Acinetobacter baumannii]
MRALQELLGEAYSRADAGSGETARERELELLGRVLDSYRETARLLDLTGRAEGGDEAAETDFIAAERALVFGHWLHP